MARGRWIPPTQKEPFVPWKPNACAECSAPHPSYSHAGMDGPWRCKACHDAAPRPLRRDPEPEAPEPPTQPSLL